MSEQDSQPDSGHFFDLFQAALRDRSRPHKAVMFADIVGSTAMKAAGTEVNWLPTVGAVLDYVTMAVKENGGIVVKYLGDGALAVFDDDRAAQAINSAIDIQERLQKANNEQFLSCNCSIGIATGAVVEFSGAGGGLDFIGSTVDLAARLCGSANAGAVFVDAKTVEAANMGRVASQFGTSSPEGHNYLSPEERIPVKGFANTIAYREIVWTRQRFGVRGGVVTDLVERVGAAPDRPVTTTPSTAPSAGSIRPSVGRVRSWNSDRGQGWITCDDGDRYADRRYLAQGVESLKVGQKVAFVELPSDHASGRPRAGCIVPEQVRLNLTLNRINVEKGYGFSDILDTRTNSQGIFIYLGEQTDLLSRGENVTIDVEVTEKGARGQLIVDQPAP